MSRTWMFTGVIVAFVPLVLLPPDQLGYSQLCVEGSCRTKAGTSLSALATAVALIALAFLVPRRTQQPGSIEPVSFVERFAALIIDYSIGLAAMMCLVALPWLLTESIFAGEFRWSLDREADEPTDSLAGVSVVFAMLFGLLLYVQLYSIRRCQTVGAYILGFAIVPSVGSDAGPYFGRRIAYVAVGFWAWPISLFLAARRKDKEFWWNIRSNTRLRRVQ